MFFIFKFIYIYLILQLQIDKVYAILESEEICFKGDNYGSNSK